MPPTPWLIRNPTVERPFVGDELPLLRPETRKRATQSYRAYPRSKVYVVGPTGIASLSYGQTSADEAMRRTLERCGFESGQACMVVAVDDTFVAPIPTLARVVGFYRPAALTTVHAGARDDVARQLANTTDGWNAVAVGAGGNAGVKTAAGSEQSAIDGALAECGKRDRECRVAVIGPFLVEQDQGGARATSNAAPSR
jgi:adenylate cyclase